MASHGKDTQEVVAGADASAGHVLLLPYPSQGHVHPMLQFAKRLAHHGLRPTLAVSRYILATCKPDAAAVGDVRLAAVSDGCDAGGFGECNDVTAYLALLESAGSETLGELLDAEAAEGRPVRAMVYDAFLPWARGVAQRHGAAAVAFFTQPCAVNVVYGHVWCERVGVPVEAGSTVTGLPGLPALEPEGLPWFLKVGPGPYPGYFEMVMSQFKGLDLADDVLVNSFYELEPEVSGVHGVGVARQDDRADGAGVLRGRRPHAVGHQVRLPPLRAHGRDVRVLAVGPPGALRGVRLLRQPVQPGPGGDARGGARPPGRRPPVPLGRARVGEPQAARRLRRRRRGARRDGGVVVPAAGGAGAPGRGVLPDALRLELDVGGAGGRRADGGAAAVDGPADERQVRGGRVAGGRARAARRRGRARAEGGGGGRDRGGDGRRAERRVQEERRCVGGEGPGGQRGGRQLRPEHRRVRRQVWIQLQV
uniref:Cytokinin-O-glucosyltransferase 2 n=1 Tax=Aegilops tauschii subsp. strangulata TaxID=200361 RepID=A0A453LCE5_AEGTS